MRRRLTSWLALLVVAGATALAAAMPPASAESGSQPYVRRNAPAGIDITTLAVDNGKKRFTMRVAVRDLGERGRFQFHYWSGRRPTPPKRSLIIIVRRVDGDTTAELMTCDREECVPDPCRTLRAAWDPDADVVEVSAPQRCYPRADPDADPPSLGRFFAWSERGRHVDDNPPPPLLLARG